MISHAIVKSENFIRNKEIDPQCCRRHQRTPQHHLQPFYFGLEQDRRKVILGFMAILKWIMGKLNEMCVAWSIWLLLPTVCFYSSLEFCYNVLFCLFSYFDFEIWMEKNWHEWWWVIVKLRTCDWNDSTATVQLLCFFLLFLHLCRLWTWVSCSSAINIYIYV